MALSLNQVKKSKSANPPKAAKVPVESREPRDEVKKVRPWQNPSEVPPTPPPAPTQGELQEWLKAAEALKNKGLSQLPSEVRGVIESSWLGKVQLAPRIRIPIPSIFVTKERP